MGRLVYPLHGRTSLSWCVVAAPQASKDRAVNTRLVSHVTSPWCWVREPSIILVGDSFDQDGLFLVCKDDNIMFANKQN